MKKRTQSEQISAENVLPFRREFLRPDAAGRPLRRVENPRSFHFMLELERQRTDRYGQGFSLLLFDCKGLHDDPSLLDLFSHEIARRVREVDIVGWLDGTRLGIVLPQTSLEGSKVVAEKLCVAISRPIRPPYSVLKYPPDTHENSFHLSCQDERQRKHWFLPEEWPEREKPLPSWKRGVDILGSALLIVLLAPLWLFLAGFIKLFSGGPVLFRQRRVGYRGRPFTLLKFRTMTPSADPSVHRRYIGELIHSSRPMHKLDGEAEGDLRISPFSRFMRRSCLDELPQLVNVLRGEMSLVGPRPCLPYEADQFMLWHRRRFDLVPGMTGLWQVSGKNATTFADMVRLDLQYEQKRSLFLDLRIMLRTVPAILALKL